MKEHQNLSVLHRTQTSSEGSWQPDWLGRRGVSLTSVFNFCVSSGLWVTHLLDRCFHHIHLNTETQNNCSVFVWRGLSVLTLERTWVPFCSYIASRHLTHYPAPAYEMFSSEPHRTVFSNLFCCTGLLFVKILNVRTPRALLPLHSTVCIS